MAKRSMAVVLALVLALGVAGTAFADDPEPTTVTYTVIDVSDDTEQTSSVDGMLKDDVLYVPVEVLFDTVGVRNWVARGDNVYFPVGHRVASAGALTDDAGVVYVAALDALTDLGVEKGLSGDRLFVKVW